MSIRCLTSQHIFRFFHFYRGFFFAPFCVVLLNASLSDGHKKACLPQVTFPENLDPLSLTPEGPVVPLVCVFRRRDNLLAWRELFANLNELKYPILLVLPDKFNRRTIGRFMPYRLLTLPKGKTSFYYIFQSYTAIIKLSSDIQLARHVSETSARTIFFAEGHPQRWEVTLRQLRSLVQKILLIQSMSKECCIVVKRRNLLQKERETESSNFWICITHLKKGK